jgi:hypothetical protein
MSGEKKGWFHSLYDATLSVWVDYFLMRNEYKFINFTSESLLMKLVKSNNVAQIKNQFDHQLLNTEDTIYRLERMNMLSYAVALKRKEIVRLCLSRRSDPNYRGDNEVTPLMRAAANDDLPIVRMLIEHHADPSLKDDRGWTASDYADLYDNPEMAEYLRNLPTNSKK